MTQSWHRSILLVSLKKQVILQDQTLLMCKKTNSHWTISMLWPFSCLETALIMEKRLPRKAHPLLDNKKNLVLIRQMSLRTHSPDKF